MKAIYAFLSTCPFIIGTCPWQASKTIQNDSLNNLRKTYLMITANFKWVMLHPIIFKTTPIHVNGKTLMNIFGCFSTWDLKVLDVTNMHDKWHI